jgi:hypothetical protein
MEDAPKLGEAMRARPASRPFRSKLGGKSVLVGAALLACAALYWGYHVYDIQDFEKLDIKIIGGLVLAALCALPFGLKMLTVSAEEVLSRDHRKPVVYLRPFNEDSRRVAMCPIGRRVGGWKIAQSSSPAALSEQRLTGALSHIGPFVAVGAPGDFLAPLGAARLYLADDTWQEEVEALVRGAAAIVLLPETTEGTRWEVTKVARWVDPRRVLVLVPNPVVRPLGYARIKALMAETLPIPLPENCGNVDAFMFDSTWQPQPIVLERRTEKPLRLFVEQVQQLSNEPAKRA